MLQRERGGQLELRNRMVVIGLEGSACDAEEGGRGLLKISRFGFLLRLLLRFTREAGKVS